MAGLRSKFHNSTVDGTLADPLNMHVTNTGNPKGVILLSSPPRARLHRVQWRRDKALPYKQRGGGRGKENLKQSPVIPLLFIFVILRN